MGSGIAPLSTLASGIARSRSPVCSTFERISLFPLDYRRVAPAMDDVATGTSTGNRCTSSRQTFLDAEERHAYPSCPRIPHIIDSMGSNPPYRVSPAAGNDRFVQPRSCGPFADVSDRQPDQLDDAFKALFS